MAKGYFLQGTILILDGVSTNRIMLKVQLSAAYYHVIQSDRLEGLVALALRTRPDLIVAAMKLPDGDVDDLCRMLRAHEALATIPVIAVSPQNDRPARQRALQAGADDVLSQPLDDTMLQARIRSLLRLRNNAEELKQGDGSARMLGLAEPPATFTMPADVALLTREPATGVRWQAQLSTRSPDRLRLHRFDDMHALMAEDKPADAIVIALSRAPGHPGMRALADLRARGNTRHAAILAIPDPADPVLAADALDMGADDVMPDGFCAEELALRLRTQLARKRTIDRLRDTVRDGLRAAIRDPMTGLYNRRYALPHLARVARQADEAGRPFAVMLADLDHFKQINDRFGHPAGDAVLIETARRLRAALRPQDMLARVGGEEFMIVMPDTDLNAATVAARQMCRAIEAVPFHSDGCNDPIPVTISIGVVGSPGPGQFPQPATDQAATRLIGQADKALYLAKEAGRNQVTLFSPAAA